MFQLGHFDGVEIGDVLLVAQWFQTAEMSQQKMWRWFGDVQHKEKRQTVKVLRIGAPDEKPRFLSLRFLKDGESVHLLEPHEWPDGVHAFRARMLLTGQIDI